jgi:hypothetical protein
LLVRIDRYNGLPDDAVVRVAAFSSPGVEGALDGGSVPLFDGGDRWSVDALSTKGQVDGGYVAVAEDTAAYVSNGVVVARLDFPLTIGSSLGVPVTLNLSNGIIVASLGRRDALSPYTLSGVLAGRWAASDLLTGLESYPDPFEQGKYLCGNDATYGALKQSICRGVDIHKRADTDGTNTRCDAFSMALRFDAVAAELGSVISRSDASRPCGPTWSDSCP